MRTAFIMRMDLELEILLLKKEILELKYGANSDRLLLRYNENHDPDNGQFTSGPGGGSGSAEATGGIQVAEPPKLRKPLAKPEDGQSTTDFKLASKNDPLHDALGAATDSHPQEVEAFRKELAESGVELIERENEELAYSPGLNPGEPGQIHISRGASYGAWLHEMQHFRDDRDSGWLGFYGLVDEETHVAFERRAYAVEIEIARSIGREDIVERLEVLLDEEIRRILGEFDGD